MAPGSIMPSYPFLFTTDLDKGTTMSKIHAMRKLGVPYPEGYESIANDDIDKQAASIANSLKENKIEIEKGKEIVALIAYLQRLGKDIKLSDK
jgi:cytochrome c oxidase cbb3-type subunit I/II